MYGRNVIEGYSMGYNNWIHSGISIFVALIFIFLVFLLIKQVLNYMQISKPNLPLEELKMRFARGEIEEKEYNEKKNLLL